MRQLCNFVHATLTEHMTMPERAQFEQQLLEPTSVINPGPDRDRERDRRNARAMQDPTLMRVGMVAPPKGPPRPRKRK